MMKIRVRLSGASDVANNLTTKYICHSREGGNPVEKSKCLNAYMNSQPTILVKKADGTTVRMTLDELKKMKSQPKVGPSLPAGTEPMVEKARQGELRSKRGSSGGKGVLGQETKKFPKPPTIKVRQIKPRKRQDTKIMFSNLQKEAGRISTSRSENKKVVDNKWGIKDHKSLLDEPFDDNKDLPVLVKENEHSLASTSPVKEIFVDEAKYEKNKVYRKGIHKINGKVRQDELRSKRGSPGGEGALGHKKTKKDMPLPGGPSNHRNPMNNEIATSEALVPHTPLNQVRNDKGGVRAGKRQSTHLESKVKIPTKSFAPPLKPLGSKPTIDDVKPPKIEKQSVGPVEELGSFSVADFRRLGVNLETIKSKLIEKFETLKHDSYLVYMDGVKAWYNSPLYSQYQDVISKSLKQNKTLDVVLQEMKKSDDLKMEEFMVLLHLSRLIN